MRKPKARSFGGGGAGPPRPLNLTAKLEALAAREEPTARGVNEYEILSLSRLQQAQNQSYLDQVAQQGYKTGADFSRKMYMGVPLNLQGMACPVREIGFAELAR